LLCTVLSSLAPSRAWAYPWMIRHEYAGCATCHTDPSGSGVLTAYGRAQSELLLSSFQVPHEPDEASSFSQPLLGLVKTPDWLTVQAWVRNGYIWNMSDGKLVDDRFLQMRADVSAHLEVGSFRSTVSVGYNDENSAALAQQAWLTRASSAGNLVSREHWIGTALADDAVLVRAGRIALPFGLRNLEHTTWVRSETRTDINQAQQHGVAVAYTGERVRAELMGIVGNLQQGPTSSYSRGYAGYAELILAPRYALGVSSTVTYAEKDTTTSVATSRQAHGAFARLAPFSKLAVLAELDLTLLKAVDKSLRTGCVGLVQADLEPWQGLHAIASGEVLSRGVSGEPTYYGTWLGATWFPVAHLDLRVDAIRRTAADRPDELTLLAQLQLYL